MKHPIEPSEEKLAEMRADLLKAIESELDTPELRVWCSERTLNRYIRARKYKLDDAIKMIKDSIAWRKERQPDRIRFEDVQFDGSTGKMFIAFVGDRPLVDKEGRPVITMRPRNENLTNHAAQVRYFIYIMERASQLADTLGIDKITWMVDYYGYSTRNAAPLKTQLEILHILRNPYPERLGLAVNYKPPFLLNAFWKVIKPFVDPVTEKKLVFAPEAKAHDLLTARFDMSELEEAFGGSNKETYDHAVWTTRMLSMEEERWGAVLAEAAKTGLEVTLPPGRGGAKDSATAAPGLNLSESTGVHVDEKVAEQLEHQLKLEIMASSTASS